MIDPKSVRFSSLVNQSPVFYGWIIMLAGTFGLIMTSPAQTYVTSVFLEPMILDLGISRSLISILYAVGVLGGGIALPLVGRQIDRYGTRLIIIVITALFGLACIYMGMVQNVVTLTLGFIALRLFGHGGLTLVSQNVINQWWIRRRGTVMGISGLLFGLLGWGAFPNLINRLIPIYGWRLTFMIQGLVLLLVVIPIGAIFFRNRPEEYGLQPDGDQAPTVENIETGIIEENWTLSEAIRTPVFWGVALGIATIGMLITGLFFHVVSIFEDNGLTAEMATFVFLPIGMTNALVNLGGGVLADRIPARFLLAAGLFSQTASLVMAQYLSGTTSAIIYGIILGTTSGLVVIVSNVIWAIYFGRRYLGSISGLTTAILVTGAALGPIPLGVARDMLGSYNLALMLLALLPFTLGIANLFFKKPHKTNDI